MFVLVTKWISNFSSPTKSSNEATPLLFLLQIKEKQLDTRYNKWMEVKKSINCLWPGPWWLQSSSFMAFFLQNITMNRIYKFPKLCCLIDSHWPYWQRGNKVLENLIPKKWALVTPCSPKKENRRVTRKIRQLKLVLFSP